MNPFPFPSEPTSPRPLGNLEPFGRAPLISKKKRVPTRETGGCKDSQNAYTKRHRKKLLSLGIVKGLLNLPGTSQMHRQYLRVCGCGNVVEQRDGKLITTYCKSRACLVCNGIRTAGLIDTYGPIVDTWEDPHMLTLTVPNVPLSRLRSTVQEMSHQFRLCVRQLRKAGIEVRAVRVTEVTGKDPRSIHPHFHVLVPSEAVGRAIVSDWLGRYPKAVGAAQDVRRADRGSLKELFKYLTKLVDTDPVVLDGILTGLHRLHLVRPYGFELPKDCESDDVFDELVPTLEAWKREDEHVLWIWVDEFENWVDFDTGEVLVDTLFTVGFA